jgi:hypothetical protein
MTLPLGNGVGQSEPNAGVLKALTARVVVLPETEIEGKLAEGWPDTRVKVDRARGAIGKRDAFARPPA